MAAVARPIERVSAPEWLKRNLLTPWYNALITLLSLWIIYLIVSGALAWALTDARWETITRNLTLLMVGRYPRDQLWRVWSGIVLLGLMLGATAGLTGGFVRRLTMAFGGGLIFLALLPFQLDERLWLLGSAALVGLAMLLAQRFRPRRQVILGWFLAPIVFYIILSGHLIRQVMGGLTYISPEGWEGFLLTMMLTLVGIVASFPLGVLLALGRQSSLPAVKWVSIAYIELIRGVPLITILFMSQLVLPLFMPAGIRLDRVLRALAGIILFSAAYQAENIRGGLQAVPEGQREAARSVGLNPIYITLLIVLPQAIRAVIPALVGTAISLYKDTTLVAVVGLLDLFGLAQAITAQTEFLRRFREVYVFAAFVYFIVSYTMSIVSRRIEVALGLGER